MRAFPSGCLSLALFAALLLLPLFFANAMLAALAQLGLGPRASLLAALGIFVGGLVNIPVRRIERERTFDSPLLTMFGLDRLAGRYAKKQYTTIAVNLGGCVVPVGLAAYELALITAEGALLAAVLAVGVNVAVCYAVARPMPNVGIVMPPLAPVVAAVLCAIVLAPASAPPVAFCAGVLGPLIGADLLHMRDIRRISTGVASIGGAGTFDGIVLSGLVATLLAPAGL